jgi:hypothetical protein
MNEDVTACDYLACDLVDLNRFDGVNIESLLLLLPSLVFVGIIALGIWYVIKGAMRIVRSEGDSSKIEEGKKIMKGIYIGLFMILGGIVGLVIVMTLFGSSGAPTRGGGGGSLDGPMRLQ